MQYCDRLIVVLAADWLNCYTAGTSFKIVRTQVHSVLKIFYFALKKYT